MFGVSVVVEDVVHQMQPAGDLVADLPENQLLLLIDGPSSSRGLVASDPQGLAAFIEMLTIGRVSDCPAVPRVPTETDGALVATMVDFLLAEVSRSLQTAMESW